MNVHPGLPIDQQPSVVLRAVGLTKTFPGVKALDNVDFSLRAGEVHGLVGENGAGKSTLVNLLTGVHQPDHGEILVDDRPVFFTSPRDAADAGICVIHQELAFVGPLDVATNFSLGSIPMRPGRLSRALGLVDRVEIAKRADQALAEIGDPVRKDALVESLSAAQVQTLEIARALNARFRVILLDEPTSSLGPAGRADLFRHLRILKQKGVGVLYVGHRLEEMFEVADRITVLRDGRLVAVEDAANSSVDRLVEFMTNSARKIPGVRRSSERGESTLIVEGLTREPAFRDVSFSLGAGEIVGITGLVGAGRTEMARCIYGADRADSGRIVLDGRHIQSRSPRHAINQGIAYATEDRKREGIMHWRPVRDNILVGPLSKDSTRHRVANRFSWTNTAGIKSLVRSMIQKLDIRPPRVNVLAGTMSGGNQQKLLLARLIATEPKVLILDEPTRGIDVSSKIEVWRLIKGLADEGAGVLIISTEVSELVGNVDRVLVMKRGTIVAEVSGGEITEPAIVSYGL